MESHTWLPFVQFLPRPVLIRVIGWLNTWWVKKTSPEWNLLRKRQLAELFPGAIVLREKAFGLTKSFMVVGGNRLCGLGAVPGRYGQPAGQQVDPRPVGYDQPTPVKVETMPIIGIDPKTAWKASKTHARADAGELRL